MQIWQQTLIDISNNNDHETVSAAPKHFDSLIISSQGRYHIALARKPKSDITAVEVVQQIKEQYGLEDEQLEVEAHILPVQAQPTETKLAFIFQQCKITLSGDIASFLLAKQIGTIQNYRTIVNDGNTLIFHFQDPLNHYVLFNQIHY